MDIFCFICYFVSLKRVYVDVIVNSSSQMTYRFKYDLLYCQYNYPSIKVVTLPNADINQEVMAH